MTITLLTPPPIVSGAGLDRAAVEAAFKNLRRRARALTLDAERRLETLDTTALFSR